MMAWWDAFFGYFTKIVYKEESGWIHALGLDACTSTTKEKPMSADCTVNPGLVKLKELELRRFTIKIRNQLGDRFHAKYVDWFSFDVYCTKPPFSKSYYIFNLLILPLGQSSTVVRTVLWQLKTATCTKTLPHIDNFQHPPPTWPLRRTFSFCSFFRVETHHLLG